MLGGIPVTGVCAQGCKRKASRLAKRLPSKGKALQRAQEGDQISLLVLSQLQVEEQVKELDGILQGRQSTIVQIRRRVLDAAQREGLDPSLGAAAVEFFDA